MTKLKRATYSAAIKLETAQLIVDQGNTQEDAAKVMGGEINCKYVGNSIKARTGWPDPHSITNDTRTT